jgi:hypothetical protein
MKYFLGRSIAQLGTDVIFKFKILGVKLYLKVTVINVLE